MFLKIKLELNSWRIRVVFIKKEGKWRRRRSKENICSHYHHAMLLKNFPSFSIIISFPFSFRLSKWKFLKWSPGVVNFYNFTTLSKFLSLSHLWRYATQFNIWLLISIPPSTLVLFKRIFSSFNIFLLLSLSAEWKMLKKKRMMEEGLRESLITHNSFEMEIFCSNNLKE